MPVEKKVILVFTPCAGKDIQSATSPAMSKLLQKGALCTNVVVKGDAKSLAGAGAEKGEMIWEAAVRKDFVVGKLDDNFDMCVLDAGTSVTEVETTLAAALEKAERTTVIVLVAAGTIVFYGPGFAKGKVLDTQICPCCVAPTVAYVADFPVPADCEAPIAYAALKDMDYKLNEIRKLQETIHNMEAAVERKSRQPWDKHDCA